MTHAAQSDAWPVLAVKPMNAKRLDELILDMAQNPLLAPHEDLVVYSGTRGWLSTRCYNAAMNFQGVELKTHMQVQLMNEIQLGIFRGYILESADGAIAPRASGPNKKL